MNWKILGDTMYHVKDFQKIQQGNSESDSKSSKVTFKQYAWSLCLPNVKLKNSSDLTDANAGKVRVGSHNNITLMRRYKMHYIFIQSRLVNQIVNFLNCDIFHGKSCSKRDEKLEAASAIYHLTGS